MITKDNYKIAFIFALLLVCCSIFLVGFTYVDDVYAQSYSLDELANGPVSGDYVVSSSTDSFIIYNNNYSDYRDYSGYVIKLTITDKTGLDAGYFVNASYNGFYYKYYDDVSEEWNNAYCLRMSFSDYSVGDVFYFCAPCYLSTSSQSSASSYNRYASFYWTVRGSNSDCSLSYTLELLSPADIASSGNDSYNDGYQAGIAYANSIVNSDSASYKAGYSNGVEFANGTVNESSASYLSGYQAGKSLTYHDGYQAGIAYANSIVYLDSASYKAGYSAGYSDGLNLGTSYAQNGIWANSVLKISNLTIYDDDGIDFITIPDFTLSANNYLTNYTIKFNKLFEYIESKYLTDVYTVVTSLTLDIYFNQDVVYIADVYSFYGDGLNLGVNGYFVDSDNLLYPISGTYNGELNTDYLNGFWTLPSSLASKDISAIRLNFKAAYNSFSQGSITTTNGGYSAGYSAGYNSGLSDGESVGYDKGSQVSHNASYSLGYNDGYNKGVADSSYFTFNGLISAVIDVPIKAFTSLFDWTFLGVNLKPVVLSLLSICLFVAIWKLFSRLGG